MPSRTSCTYSSRGKVIGHGLLSILATEIRVQHIDITTEKCQAKHSKRRHRRSTTPAPHYAAARADGPDEGDEADPVDSLVQTCHCCYTEQDIVDITYCPSNHPFCTPCLNSYASVELSQLSCQLRCIAASSDSSSPPCNLLLPESTLKASLSPKLHSLYEKVVQLKQVEDADLKGLEACPFCDFKMAFDETYTDIRFRCMNTNECGIVSCRGCKKKSHWPLDCSDFNENTQHAVEEAMSNALKRTCPTCATSFVKDAGCNKMKCARCNTIVCYVCRQDISNTRYDHFVQLGDPSTIDRCPMYDKNGDLDGFHEDEVNQAEASAYARLHASKALEPTIQPGMESSKLLDEADKEDEAATKLERLEEWVHNVNRIAKGAEGGFEIVGAGLIFEDEPEGYRCPVDSASLARDSDNILRGYYPVHATQKGRTQDPCRFSRASGWTIEVIPFQPIKGDEVSKGSAKADVFRNDYEHNVSSKRPADASSRKTAPFYNVHQTGSETHFRSPHPLDDFDDLINMRPHSSLSGPMSRKFHVNQRARH